MASDLSWYQRKFGRTAQPAPAQARTAPRPGPEQAPGWAYPDHRQVSPQYDPRVPAEYPPQQQPSPLRLTLHNFYEMAGHWRGGKGHQIDREPCPACGSMQYFSRVQGVRRGPPPAPLCYDCGFNGMFEQGLASSWQGGAE